MSGCCENIQEETSKKQGNSGYSSIENQIYLKLHMLPKRGYATKQTSHFKPPKILLKK